MNRVGFSAEQIAKWINDRAEINVRFCFLAEKLFQELFNYFCLIKRLKFFVRRIILDFCW